MTTPEVPVIDVSRSLDGQLGALDSACREHGFFLVSGHGLDDLIDATWSVARSFFQGDAANRRGVSRDARNPLGWNDRELTKRKRDHKEVFDFVDPSDPSSDRYNRWPSEPDGFRATLSAFYDGFSDLSTVAVELVHRALGMDPTQGLRFRGDRANSSVRLNHYSVGDPVPEDERDDLGELGETALGHHTDPGVITLLVQDDVGGLQTQDRAGAWLDVEPVPGTIVVNLGDTVQVWTNDRYRAAIHRVVAMTERERMSTPYFLNPSRDAVVEPIPEIVEDAPHYSSFHWREYMRARTDDNYADVGADDAQITDYLLRSS